MRTRQVLGEGLTGCIVQGDTGTRVKSGVACLNAVTSTLFTQPMAREGAIMYGAPSPARPRFLHGCTPAPAQGTHRYKSWRASVLSPWMRHPPYKSGVHECRDEDEDGAEDRDISEEEAGAAFDQRGLKPTEDRFMRLDDMERFVRAAEQREMEDDDEELTGDDSGTCFVAC